MSNIRWICVSLLVILLCIVSSNAYAAPIDKPAAGTIDVPITDVVWFDYERLVHHITERSTLPEEDIREIVLWYTVYGSYTRINPIVLLSQAIHETAWFSSWWSQPPRRNLAGIGVNGRSYTESTFRNQCPAERYRNRWYCGFTYNTWHDAVLHHVSLFASYTPWIVDGEVVRSREIIAGFSSVRHRTVFYTISDIDRVWSAAPSSRSIGRIARQLYRAASVQPARCLRTESLYRRGIDSPGVLMSFVCTVAYLWDVDTHMSFYNRQSVRYYTFVYSGVRSL